MSNNFEEFSLAKIFDKVNDYAYIYFSGPRNYIHPINKERYGYSIEANLFKFNNTVIISIHALLLPSFNYGKISDKRFIPKNRAELILNVDKSDSKTGYREIGTGTLYIYPDGTVRTEYPYSGSLYYGTYVYRLD